jgi:DNA-binding NarL/FixJ family response regulator
LEEDGHRRLAFRSVLVIEDDRSVRDLLCCALSDGADVDIHEAPDGRQGVALAGHHHPDLILLDLAMPGMGGLEALPLLTAVSPDSAVVVISGIDSAEIEVRARREGARAFISKSEDLSRLPEVLDRILATAGR